MNSMRVLPLIIVGIFMLMQTGFGQNESYYTKSKRAIRSYEMAGKVYHEGDLENAANYAREAVNIDSKFIEGYLLLGDILSDDGKINEAIDAYQHAISIKAYYYYPVYYFIAKLELKTGKYDQALQHCRTYLTYPGISQAEMATVDNIMTTCDFAMKAMQHPVQFNLVNLGDSVNGKYDEYVNAITVDGQKLYLTLHRTFLKDDIRYMGLSTEDFYVSTLVDGVWSKKVSLGPPVNTVGNEGALSISPDGMHLFFAACSRDDSYGSCDIYYSRRIGNHWSTPVNAGDVINSPWWDSQPCLSSDGRTLYFVSSRPGGYGKSDIWESVMQADGNWSDPQNLGDVINTPEDEMAPFLHPDGQTLYFSSKGHVGMGGADIFMSTKNDGGEWTEPVNLGYPINTCADEITIIVDATGKTAYISTDKPGGKGGIDIYSFELDSALRPAPVTYLKGIIFNSENKHRIEAKFEIIDLNDGKTVVESFSNPVNGEFLVCIPTDKDYALNVSSPNYLFYSEHITTSSTRTILDPYLINIALKPIKAGESIILKNIFFDTDKYVLKPESLVELNKLLDLLRNNTNMHIEISGHTDDVGTEAYNEKLSTMRAKAVYDYLIRNGISPDRLAYKGYGYSRPIDSNLTEEGRANNRRTEFKVISN